MAALSQIYTALAVLFLSSWTLTALGFAALDVLNSNRELMQVVASTSLLTFLVCRLLVASQPKGESTIAHLLTTAYQRSRVNALALLLFTSTWLYELLCKSVIMLFITLFGGVLVSAIYNDAFVESGTEPTMEQDLETTAIAQIGEFKKKVGVDLTGIIKMIPPKLWVYIIALVWFNFATLGLYVLRLTWKSLKTVFGSASVAPTATVEKNDDELR